jgi:hypothetical protein
MVIGCIIEGGSLIHSHVVADLLISLMAIRIRVLNRVGSAIISGIKIVSDQRHTRVYLTLLVKEIHPTRTLVFNIFCPLAILEAHGI